jgi:hypothetical protein
MRHIIFWFENTPVDVYIGYRVFNPLDVDSGSSFNPAYSGLVIVADMMGNITS